MPEFPQEIKRGSISVTVYATSTKGCSAYALSYYADGRRKREMSTDYPSVRQRAGEEDLKDLSTRAHSELEKQRTPAQLCILAWLARIMNSSGKTFLYQTRSPGLRTCALPITIRGDGLA